MLTELNIAASPAPSNISQGDYSFRIGRAEDRSRWPALLIRRGISFQLVTFAMPQSTTLTSRNSPIATFCHVRSR